MIRYTVHLCDPKAHLFAIEVTFKTKATKRFVTLQLPRWISGSYLIREFSAQVHSEKAFVSGKPAVIGKTGLSTWRVDSADLIPGSEIVVTYRFWAFDTSVRTAFLDTSRAFFNPGALCMQVCEAEASPVEVLISIDDFSPALNWRVVTGLPGKHTGNRFGPYQARDYATLLDAPFCLGAIEECRFRVNGVNHTIAVTDAPKNTDFKQLVHDIRKICVAQIDFFDPQNHRAPMDNYTFFLQVTGKQYGGLEHCFSTALAAPEKCLPRIGKSVCRKDYIDLLGLFSHEYFHAWNVKRIKPREFFKPDFLREVPTRLLWFFEGFTSYYEPLFLVRTGLIKDTEYLNLLGETLHKVLSTHAQEVQSLSASSFDAWIKFYRPTPNSVNTNVSYYQQGALAALVLDAEIRKSTHGEKSLDDVMRHILSQIELPGYKGIRRDDIEKALRIVSGKNLNGLLNELTETTCRPDYEMSLATYGIRLATRRLPIEREILGIDSRRDASGLVVCRVHTKETGECLGLSQGDTISFVAQTKVSTENWPSLLKRYKEGDSLRLRVKRDGHTLMLQGFVGKIPSCVSRPKITSLTRLGEQWLRGTTEN